MSNKLEILEHDYDVALTGCMRIQVVYEEALRAGLSDIYIREVLEPIFDALEAALDAATNVLVAYKTSMLAGG